MSTSASTADPSSVPLSPSALNPVTHTNQPTVHALPITAISSPIHAMRDVHRRRRHELSSAHRSHFQQEPGKYIHIFFISFVQNTGPEFNRFRVNSAVASKKFPTENGSFIKLKQPHSPIAAWWRVLLIMGAGRGVQGPTPWRTTRRPRDARRLEIHILNMRGSGYCDGDGVISCWMAPFLMLLILT